MHPPPIATNRRTAALVAASAVAPVARTVAAAVAAAVVTTIAAAALAAPAAAQAGPHFLPVGAPFLVHQTTSFAQKQGRVAMDPEGDLIAVVWAASAPDYAIMLRLFDGGGAPLTNEILVNPNLNIYIQDEPSVAVDEGGNVLVCWSDRHGYDGDGMGVYARVFHGAGVPWGPEFLVSTQWQQSQWEPFCKGRPGGGFVIGWTGKDDGDSYLRLFGPTGTAQGPEIPVNTYTNNAQTDPEPSVARNGTLFASWIDFGGNGGAGNLTNIFARTFDAAGVPQQPVEFLVNGNTLPGEQREPKNCADGLGRFLVTWEDRQLDAGGIDIMARRFDTTGSPLGPEFQVNTSSAGDQVFPELAADWVGNFVIAWEDHALPGNADIRARRYDAQGQPLGADFLVTSVSAGDQGFPGVAMDWAGEQIAVCYTTPGDAGDEALQLYRFSPITRVGAASPGGTFALQLDLPGGAGLYRIMLAALGTLPGLPLPDGRRLHLSYDPLFQFVLAHPDAGGLFTGFVGPIDGSATASASVTLPPNGSLVGLLLQFAVVTLDLSKPTLATQLRHVTDPLAVVIQ